MYFTDYDKSYRNTKSVVSHNIKDFANILDNLSLLYKHSETFVLLWKYIIFILKSCNTNVFRNALLPIVSITHFVTLGAKLTHFRPKSGFPLLTRYLYIPKASLFNFKYKGMPSTHISHFWSIVSQAEDLSQTASPPSLGTNQSATERWL